MDSGQVLVNSKVVGSDYVIRNGDLIAHKSHIHEQPVTSRPIKIVEETEEYLVIDKPSGIPVRNCTSLFWC